MKPEQEKRLRELIKDYGHACFEAGMQARVVAPEIKPPREAIVSFVREMILMSQAGVEPEPPHGITLKDGKGNVMARLEPDENAENQIT